MYQKTYICQNSKQSSLKITKDAGPSERNFKTKILCHGGKRNGITPLWRQYIRENGQYTIITTRKPEQWKSAVFSIPNFNKKIGYNQKN